MEIYIRQITGQVYDGLIIDSVCSGGGGEEDAMGEGGSTVDEDIVEVLVGVSYSQLLVFEMGYLAFHLIDLLINID